MPEPTVARAWRASRSATWIELISILLLVGGCADSAERATTEVPTWTVSEAPLLSIGGSGSTDTTALFQIRGAARFDDGRIAVADGGARVLVFDSLGRHTTTIGRPGEGPGEFRVIAWMRLLRPDTLLVYDFSARRATYFSGAGEILSSTTAAPSVTWIGRFDDGTMVARRGQSLPPTRGTIVRPRMEFTRQDAGSRDLAPLASVDGDEILVTQDGRFHSGGILRRSLTAVGPQHLYLTTGERFQVQVYSRDGGPPRLLSREYEARPVPPEYFASSSLGRVIAELPAGERSTTLPPISALIATQNGELWVEEFSLDLELESNWTVFGADGEVAAQISLPPRLRPMQVGPDFLLGVWRDELDVEHVQLYSLDKGGLTV